MFMREVQLLQNQLIINTQKKLLSTHVGVVSFNPQIRQAIYVKNVKEKLKELNLIALKSLKIRSHLKVLQIVEC